ncbi:hypothetical protein [Streptomyces sp. NPDC058291]|uniref:hypothetical protein n=1 Tax=Streptomyces sp. NPDC058291 TaxID=3346427 RepID=UPI0036E8397A
MSAALRLLSAPPTIALPWTAIAWTTGACALLALTASLATTATALRRPARTTTSAPHKGRARRPSRRRRPAF